MVFLTISSIILKPFTKGDKDTLLIENSNISKKRPKPKKGFYKSGKIGAAI